MPRTYEVKDTTGKIHTIAADGPLDACQRVADLHQVDVTAWRYPRTDIVVGCQTPD